MSCSALVQWKNVPSLCIHVHFLSSSHTKSANIPWFEGLNKACKDWIIVRTGTYWNVQIAASHCNGIISGYLCSMNDFLCLNEEGSADSEVALNRLLQSMTALTNSSNVTALTCFWKPSLTISLVNSCDNEYISLRCSMISFVAVLDI